MASSSGDRAEPERPAPPRRLIVGISGATGIAYGVAMLQALRPLEIETHLVVTKAGQLTRAYETDISSRELAALADVSYKPGDVGAPIASGSFPTIGMIVAPCSMRSLAEIANGVSSGLLARAADVTLKERRRLVLMVRESPLTTIHLRNMLAVTEAGAIVMPPLPAFYPRPTRIEQIVSHSVGRALDLFGIDVLDGRWGEP